MSGGDWTPSSWRNKTVAQDIEYPDEQHLERVLSRIKKLPPLVTPAEIERLRYQLAQVHSGRAFILHAGDCAESFDAVTHENICNKIGLILSFSLVLIWGARLPVVRIGRIAGQYAKPRSSAYEVVDGTKVLSFRGDNINGYAPEERTPDPERLLSAYFHSTTTLNYIRGLLTSGFADLHHPRDWSLSHVRSPSLRVEFERLANGLSDALDFTSTIGAPSNHNPFEAGGGKGVLGEVDFYVSHEGLMLSYEEVMTRKLSLPLSLQSTFEESPQKAYYNTSAHFLWIGDRTRQIDGAHVEYFRGIRNPIGIKVGPSMQSDELVRLLRVVNPDNIEGKVTLITRYGAEKIVEYLPRHIRAVQLANQHVVWVCDPMHGNTLISASGLKTRNFGTIISEINSCLAVHAELNSRLGGISLEFTGELNEDGFSVTECLGGSMELTEDQLELRYQSFCDPRLNFEQSLDLAFLISNHLKAERTSKQDSQAGLLFTELGGKWAGAGNSKSSGL